MELAIVVLETPFVLVAVLKLITDNTNIPGIIAISAGADQAHAPFVAGMILVLWGHNRCLLTIKKRTFRTIQVGSSGVAGYFF